MNIEMVGLENLPNVFINNVKIEDFAGENIKKITVTTCIYDEIPFTWRERGFNIDIKMAVITDLNAINEINTGAHIEEVEGYDLFFVSTKSADSANEVEIDSSISSYKKFKNTFVFSINIQDNPDVNVYCYCSIPSIDFGIKEFDKFCGPLTGEQVFRSSSVVDISGYFYDPNTNEEYGGPVYTIDGKYYKGSYESENPIEVFYVSEDNMKLRYSNVED